MPKLTNEWKPSQEVINQYKEVNHDREIKYFKHFYITNQYNKEYIVEVKYRAVDGFPNPFKVLDNRDIALYKRKTGDPRWVVIIPDKIFKEILK